MTLIPAIEPELSTSDAAGSYRNSLISNLGDFGQLGKKPWRELKEVEIFPGSPLGAEVVTLPRDWMPSGTAERASFRTFSPSRAISAKGSLDAEAAWDESLRRSMLALWLPRRTNTGIRVLKPSTWAHNVRLLFRAADMLTKKHLEMNSIWLHLELSDILQIQQDISSDDATRRIFRTLVRTLSDAGSRGVITDYPKIFMSPEAEPLPNSIEKPYRSAKHESEVQKKRDNNWQPFSDVFVTEFVRRSLWFQANLADSLLQCWSDLRKIVNRQELEGRRSGNPDAIAERNAYIASFPWRDPSGQPISQLPFAVCHRGTGWSEFSTAWPPGGLRGIISAVAALQIMNLGVVAFCTGARASELGDASLTSLGLQNGERFRARTFKLAEEKTGKLRDWPLHPLAARALNIQVELSNICRPSGSKHLWCMINRDGGKLLNLTEPLVNAVEYIGVSDLTGLSRAHIHRWRHTVGKLVALSVIGAPQVLLDLFGHRDLEMTLRYMLSDPDIGQEAMRVAKETSIALAMEAIEEAIDGEASGPAAATLAQGLEARRLQRGEEKYGAETLREAAEILTFHGKQWEVVRPGILCTKTIGQFGPCTQGRGAPDPGSCRTDCDHRFELARAKKHCEETILALLTERNVAEAQGAEMLLANLDGQILANLKRWADVRERIIASSALARRLWEESLVEA